MHLEVTVNPEDSLLETGDFNVTREPTIYVYDGELKPEDVGVIKVPRCMDGFAPFALMATFCCVFTIIIPVIFFVYYSDFGDDVFLIVACASLAIGCIYFCCFTSFLTLLKDGALCMPTAPPKASVWTSQEGAEDAGGENKTKHIMVIVNPKAGVDPKGKLSKLQVCQQVWERHGHKVTVVETTHAGHAKEIARETTLEGVDVLCAIGGDGTLHELSNGFLARADFANTHTSLGFLPGGSGNSVMCDLGTWDLATAAEVVANVDQNKRRMDVIKVGTKKEVVASINTIVFGLIADIGVLAEKHRWMGPKRYENVAAFKLMCGYSQNMKLTMVDEANEAKVLDGQFLTCFINKTQYFGKGMRAAPNARLDNGLFELVCVKAGVAGRGALLAVLNQIKTGAHIHNAFVEVYRMKRAVCVFDAPGVLIVDGEVLTHDGKVTIDCFKQHLNVIADKNLVAGAPLNY